MAAYFGKNLGCWDRRLYKRCSVPFGSDPVCLVHPLDVSDWTFTAMGKLMTLAAKAHHLEVDWGFLPPVQIPNWCCLIWECFSRWWHCCSKPSAASSNSRSGVVPWWLITWFHDTCRWITGYSCGSVCKHTCWDDTDLYMLFPNFSYHGNKTHFLLHAVTSPQHCALISTLCLSSPHSFIPSEQW